MQKSHNHRFFTVATMALVSNTFIATQLVAQDSPLSQPGKPTIEMLEQIEAEDKKDDTDNNAKDRLMPGSELDKRQTLLSSSDRIGFGAETTGGSNEVVVSNIEEFIEAVSKPNNYVLLAPSLAGQTLYISDTVEIVAENITIDGSDAPGAVFTPSSSFKSGRVMMYARKANIIINNITLKANYYPNGSSNNVGGIRFGNDGIWVNNVTVSGLWDDAFDIVFSATNATFSKVKTYNTDKSINMFYPKTSDKRISIHSSDLAGRQRNPWNQGAQYVHIWNNYIHDAQWSGPIAGLSASQYKNNNRTSPGPANIISEYNVFENTGSDALRTYTESAGLLGYIHSNGDDLGGGNVIGQKNVTYTDKPSLFKIPYVYSPLPVDEVKAYVIANAGAS